MPMTAHQIIIRDPEFLQKTIAEMVKLQKVEAFANTYARLLSLCADYLAVETAEDRTRMVTVWANPCEQHEFRFWIREEPLNARSKDQGSKNLLAGVMHFHADTQTWSINT